MTECACKWKIISNNRREREWNCRNYGCRKLCEHCILKFYNCTDKENYLWHMKSALWCFVRREIWFRKSYTFMTHPCDKSRETWRFHKGKFSLVWSRKREQHKRASHSHLSTKKQLRLCYQTSGDYLTVYMILKHFCTLRRALWHVKWVKYFLSLFFENDLKNERQQNRSFVSC